MLHFLDLGHQGRILFASMDGWEFECSVVWGFSTFLQQTAKHASTYFQRTAWWFSHQYRSVKTLLMRCIIIHGIIKNLAVCLLDRFFLPWGTLHKLKEYPAQCDFSKGTTYLHDLLYSPAGLLLALGNNHSFSSCKTTGLHNQSREVCTVKTE